MNSEALQDASTNYNGLEGAQGQQLLRQLHNIEYVLKQKLDLFCIPLVFLITTNYQQIEGLSNNKEEEAHKSPQICCVAYLTDALVLNECRATQEMSTSQSTTLP